MKNLIAGFLTLIVLTSSGEAFAARSACYAKVQSLRQQVNSATRDVNRTENQLNSSDNRVLNLQLQKLKSLVNISSQESSYKAAARWFQASCVVTIITGGTVGCQTVTSGFTYNPNGTDYEPGPDGTLLPGKRRTRKVCVDSPQQCITQSISMEVQLATLTARRKVQEKSWDNQISYTQKISNRLQASLTSFQTKLDALQRQFDTASVSCNSDQINLDCQQDYIKQCNRDRSACYSVKSQCRSQAYTTCRQTETIGTPAFRSLLTSSYLKCENSFDTCHDVNCQNLAIDYCKNVH